MVKDVRDKRKGSGFNLGMDVDEVLLPGDVVMEKNVEKAGPVRLSRAHFRWLVLAGLLLDDDVCSFRYSQLGRL